MSDQDGEGGVGRPEYPLVEPEACWHQADYVL
jgi:hypothetical protein